MQKKSQEWKILLLGWWRIDKTLIIKIQIKIFLSMKDEPIPVIAIHVKKATWVNRFKNRQQIEKVE